MSEPTSNNQPSRSMKLEQHEVGRFTNLTHYEQHILSAALKIGCTWVEDHDNQQFGQGVAWITMQSLLSELSGHDSIPIPDPNVLHEKVNGEE